MENKRNLKKPLSLILGAVLLVVITIVIVIAVIQKNDHDKKVNEKVLARGFVEENNAETIVSDLKEKVEEGMFECLMTTDWTFPDGKSEAPNSLIANSENNRYTFYFDIFIEDTEELVYSSPLVPVGSEIKNIKLDKELPAGKYSMIVQYTMVDEYYNEVSDVGFRINVEILK